jgi:hypothetical protein
MIDRCVGGRGRTRLAKIGGRLAGILAAAVLAGPAPAQDHGRKKRETAEGTVLYAEPAPQMSRVSVLVGRWAGRMTWSEPRRYKRGRYEGYPGPDGEVVRSVERGPGGFSLVWTDEGRGPMGGYTTRAMLAWDPSLRAYVVDSVHSLFPGISRLSGHDVDGALAFRGDDVWIDPQRSLRVTWKDFSATGWTEVVEASERGGPLSPVVTVRFERSAEPSAAPLRP